MLSYVSTAEFAARVDVELPPEPELHAVLSTASQWCDEYLGYPLAAHLHVEHTRLRPDRDGRLVWYPQHRPFIALESLTCNRTTYTSPTVSLLDERTVVVDLKMATSWTGALQFGPSVEMNATWHYRAGYSPMPSAVKDATVLWAISSLGEQDLIADAQNLLDLLR